MKDAIPVGIAMSVTLLMFAMGVGIGHMSADAQHEKKCIELKVARYNPETAKFEYIADIEKKKETTEK